VARFCRNLRSFKPIFAIVLAVVTAFAGSLPALARLAGGPPPHVCHCEVRGGHAMCQCPRCNPELRDPDDTHADVLRASCGDDEDATLGKTFVAVLGPCVVAPLPRVVTIAPSPLSPPSRKARLRDGPEAPPPKPATA